MCTPEGRDYHIAIWDVKFWDVLKVIVARKRFLDNQCDSAMSVVGRCVSMLAVVVDGDEVFVLAKMAVNVMLKIGEV